MFKKYDTNVKENYQSWRKHWIPIYEMGTIMSLGDYPAVV